MAKKKNNSLTTRLRGYLSQNRQKRSNSPPKDGAESESTNTDLHDFKRAKRTRSKMEIFNAITATCVIIFWIIAGVIYSSHPYTALWSGWLACVFAITSLFGVIHDKWNKKEAAIPLAVVADNRLSPVDDKTLGLPTPNLKDDIKPQSAQYEDVPDASSDNEHDTKPAAPVPDVRSPYENPKPEYIARIIESVASWQGI